MSYSANKSVKFLRLIVKMNIKFLLIQGFGALMYFHCCFFNNSILFRLPRFPNDREKIQSFQNSNTIVNPNKAIEEHCFNLQENNGS